jgi:hypothetical protein
VSSHCALGVDFGGMDDCGRIGPIGEAAAVNR